MQFETIVANETFTVIIELTKSGVSVTGLTNGDFPSGTAQIRQVDEDQGDVSPAAVNLDATGGSPDFQVEELFDGVYAFKFSDDVVTEIDTIYILEIDDGGTLFDTYRGAFRSRECDLAEQIKNIKILLNQGGRNSVGIVTGYDANEQVVNFTKLGFANPLDAETYIDEYILNDGAVTPATQALVTYVQEENYNYDPSDGRLLTFIQKQV